VNIKVQGDKLIIEIDISKSARDNAPPSKTGKSRMVATTSGFVPVIGADGLKLSLNVITK
jgi:hypothetical protein